MAAMLYEMAAEKGSCDGQCHLARLYKDGSCSVIKNEEKAFQLYRMCALKGSPQAQYELACMYLHGNGTICIRTEATRWFEKAAAQGHIVAAEKINWPLGFA
jgi:TPR repeat protein